MLGTIRGIIITLLMGLNLLILPTLVIIISLLKWLVPFKSGRKAIDHLTHEVMLSWWVSISTTLLKIANRSPITIRGNGELKQHGSYMLISNHRSWLDILVLQGVFNHKIPMLKFFMKQELLWTIPFGGLAVWFLGFPFMKRHSKAYLKKHPEQRDKDIETTRRTCERFKDQPVTMTNFVEGTRSTAQKRQDRTSPYQHLLAPKAGGIAFTMATMSESLHQLINVTIVYHNSNVNLWDYCCGKPQPITLIYDVVPIPDELRGDYYHDKPYRKQFQAWLNQVWRDKDALISKTQEETL